MSNTIEVLENQDEQHMFSEEPNATRCMRGWYATELDGEAAAEEAFHITNAPTEILTPDQKTKKILYRDTCPDKRLRSISVGDMVKVTKGLTTRQFLCCGMGWKEQF